MTANAYITKQGVPDLVVKSYTDAGYFGRTLRAIEVLIDQEKVRAGLGSTAALLETKAICCVCARKSHRLTQRWRRSTTVSLAPESLLNRLATVLTPAGPTPWAKRRTEASMQKKKKGPSDIVGRPLRRNARRKPHRLFRMTVPQHPDRVPVPAARARRGRAYDDIGAD